MSVEKIKVIYIVGVGRSGSTLVGRILAQNNNVAFAGEARTLPTQIHSKCGCGEKVQKCSFWSSILGEINIDAVRQARNKYRVRDLIFDPPSQINIPLGELARYYRLIQRASDARIIVDSSSFPSYLFCLSKSPGIDVRVLHLVRDPRAVAYSWWRRPLHEDKQDVTFAQRSYKSLRFENPIRSSLVWDIWNYAAERHKSWCSYYCKMSYEKFCKNPEEEIDRAIEKLGVKEKPEWAGNSKIRLPAQHSIRGNPNRFEDGIIEVEERSNWRDRLSNLTKLLVSGLTAPLLRRYGYSFKEAWINN